jgi:N-methylhydantoinase A
VRTFFAPFATLDPAELAARLRAMEGEALSEFAAEGFPPERVRLLRSADVRYVGQGFELTVPMDDGQPNAAALERLAERFHQEHERTYGHRSDGAPLQLVNLRLTALGLRDRDGASRLAARWWADGQPASRNRPPRQAYFGEAGLLPTPVLARADLTSVPRPGPLIVEEYDATTVVPPGCRAWLDTWGNIVLEVH